MASAPRERAATPHVRKHWHWYVPLIVVVALLVVGRALLPIVIERYVNRTLDRLEGYSGSVTDIDLSLWRGAYQIRGLRIVKTGGRVPVPFVEARLIDLSVEWKALLNGKIVAEIELFEPKLNFVNAKNPQQKQAEPARNWTETVRDLTPFDINRVAIHDAQIHYRDFEAEPHVDIFVQRLDATLHNITNSEKVGRTLYASFDGRARAMGSGRIKFRGKLDPYARKPTFDFAFSEDGLELKQLNSFLKAYANVDAEGGTISLDAEVAASHGKFKGYVKPFVKDLQVLKWNEEEEGFVHKIWEGIVQVVGDIFKNQKQEQIATRIPLSGTVDAPDADTWSTIFGIVRNAFLQALQRGVEGSIGPRKGDAGKDTK